MKNFTLVAHCWNSYSMLYLGSGKTFCIFSMTALWYWQYIDQFYAPNSLVPISTPKIVTKLHRYVYKPPVIIHWVTLGTLCLWKTDQVCDFVPPIVLSIVVFPNLTSRVRMYSNEASVLREWSLKAWNEIHRKGCPGQSHGAAVKSISCGRSNWIMVITLLGVVFKLVIV